MADENLLLEKDGPLATITFNNPKALNALTVATFEGLDQLLAELEKDAEIRVVILTGAGEKAFIAGGDISHLGTLDVDSAREFALLAQRVIDRLEAFPKPVIAAINGFALGGGCELALACSLRIASSSALLGLPEVQLGLMPGYGGTQRLTRLIGRGRALEMMLTGKPVTADQAMQWGLVNAVAEPEELENLVNKLAEKLARSAPCAMRGILEAAGGGADLALPEALELEAEKFTGLFETEDMREGTAAFLEKRKPKFSGR